MPQHSDRGHVTTTQDHTMNSEGPQPYCNPERTAKNHESSCDSTTASCSTQLWTFGLHTCLMPKTHEELKWAYNNGLNPLIICWLLPLGLPTIAQKHSLGGPREVVTEPHQKGVTGRSPVGKEAWSWQLGRVERMPHCCQIMATDH